jgi:hypothetical protein
MHPVQIFTLGPLGILAHWRFGYTRRSPAGLNFVARTELLYFPTTFEPFSQSGQIFAIDLCDIVISYHGKACFARLLTNGFTEPLYAHGMIDG